MKTPSTFEYQDDFDRTCFVNLSLWEAAQKLGISLTVMLGISLRYLIDGISLRYRYLIAVSH